MLKKKVLIVLLVVAFIIGKRVKEELSLFIHLNESELISNQNFKIENQINQINEGYSNSTKNQESFNINSSQTTVVSVYFAFNRSKHNQRKYFEWNRDMLLSVSAPLVIFTDHSSRKILMSIRSNESNFKTIFYTYESRHFEHF